MNEPTPVFSLPTVQVRNEPVQARASARVESLLDATASVIEDGGYEVLTTAMVAHAANTSIGTVYRYFPDRIALLVALAARNAERLSVRIERALADEAHTSWWDALEAASAEYVIAYREIPSFRMLRTGDMLDLGPRSEPTTSERVLEYMLRALVQRFGFEDTPRSRAALDESMAIIDAMSLLAFVRDRDGDPAILELAHTLARRHLNDTLGRP